MKFPVLTGLALVLLPFAPALAAAPLSPQDLAFVRQAALGGMAEVAEGQMAVTKAASPDVKQFGQHMIDDHTPNNQALEALAQRKGLKTPATLDRKHVEEATTLNRQSGTAFDRAYIRGQVAGHKQMEKVMQTEIQGGRDPDLKAFAQTTLPTVEEHLTMAQAIEGKM